MEEFGAPVTCIMGSFAHRPLRKPMSSCLLEASLSCRENRSKSLVLHGIWV